MKIQPVARIPQFYRRKHKERMPRMVFDCRVCPLLNECNAVQGKKGCIEKLIEWRNKLIAERDKRKSTKYRIFEGRRSGKK